VRLGRPRGIGGLTDIVSGPVHAGGVGLVLYGIGQDGKVPLSVFREEAAPAPAPAPTPADAKSGGRPEVVVATPAAPPAPKKEKTRSGGTVLDRVRGFFKDWM
jgi:cell division protein FtsA